MVHKCEHAIHAVTGDELYRLADAVHVRAVRGAGNLTEGKEPSDALHNLEEPKGSAPRAELTCNLPMATRQNLLLCPASWSSSGNVTPVNRTFT